MTGQQPPLRNAFWLNDFNRENLIDYAEAARSMSVSLRLLFDEGFDSIVVPSRGAWPLLKAAQSAWYIERSAMKNGPLRQAEQLKMLRSPLHQATVLPFSADPRTDTQTTAAIRNYWTRVLAAIVKRNGTDPHLVTYKAMIENLTKGSFPAVLPRNTPSEKFIFIDTVISGRAICEIASAFKEAGLNHCHFMLIVDDEGRSIKGKYARTIETLEADQRCTRIPVRKLFTEDQGPAVSGIWSTVYPQILEELQKAYPWASKAYGAGSFYHRISSSQVQPSEGLGDAEYNMPMTIFFASLTTALHYAMSELHNIDLLPECSRPPVRARMEDQLDFQLHMAREELTKFGELFPLDKGTTRLLASPRVLEIEPEAEITVSSSHLVRVTFPDHIVRDYMRKIDNALLSRKNALADDWFRNI